MFYEGCIEVFAIQFCDVMKRLLFSERELTLGSDVLAVSNRLSYMSDKDKLLFSSNMADRGLMLRDEIRALWGLAPLPNGIGQTIPARGEYYNLGEKSGKDISVKDGDNDASQE